MYIYIHLHPTNLFPSSALAFLFSQRHLSPAICLSAPPTPLNPSQTLTNCLRFKLSNQAASPLHCNTLTHTDPLVKKTHTFTSGSLTKIIIFISPLNKCYRY